MPLIPPNMSSMTLKKTKTMRMKKVMSMARMGIWVRTNQASVKKWWRMDYCE